jgi:hypothetical protein
MSVPAGSDQVDRRRNSNAKGRCPPRRRSLWLALWLQTHSERMRRHGREEPIWLMAWRGRNAHIGRMATTGPRGSADASAFVTLSGAKGVSIKRTFSQPRWPTDQTRSLVFIPVLVFGVITYKRFDINVFFRNDTEKFESDLPAPPSCIWCRGRPRSFPRNRSVQGRRIDRSARLAGPVFLG